MSVPEAASEWTGPMHNHQYVEDGTGTERRVYGCPVCEPAGVPEAAWSAAAQALYDHEWDEDRECCACGLATDAEHTDHQADVALDAAAPFIVAAAVAEEQATTGRRIEAMAKWYDLSSKVRGWDDPVKSADASAADNLRSLLAPPRCQTCGDSGEKGCHDETGAFICSDCLRAALASPGEGRNWLCPRCSLYSAPTTARCPQCGTEKPASAASPGEGE